MTSTKTMFDQFPHDLQLQIFKRLPFNTLLKLRTVSKSWNSLITTHDLISAHLNHNKPQLLLIRYFDRTLKTEQYITTKDNETFATHFSNIHFQFASKGAYFRLVGYCNGVVCLSDDLFHDISTLVLWNPSIRKSVRVFVPCHEQTWPQCIVLGFGVCPLTHDPKIIKITFINNYSINDRNSVENSPLVDVFSVISGIWRKPFGGNSNSNSNSNSKKPRKTVQMTWSQVSFNGVVHWIGCDRRIEASVGCLIVSFDLVHEVFGEMLLPDGLASRDVVNLGISSRKGELTMLEYDMGKGNECCGVWVMKEYGVVGSWEKLYVVRLPGMLRKVVGFRMNGDIVLALKNHELVFVDRDGNVKSVGIYGNVRSFFVGSYVESLILINDSSAGSIDVYCYM